MTNEDATVRPCVKQSNRVTHGKAVTVAWSVISLFGWEILLDCVREDLLIGALL